MVADISNPTEAATPLAHLAQGAVEFHCWLWLGKAGQDLCDSLKATEEGGGHDAVQTVCRKSFGSCCCLQCSNTQLAERLCTLSGQQRTTLPSQRKSG